MNSQDRQEQLNKISEWVKDLDKIRRERIEKIHLELEPLYEDIKSICPHDYKEKLSERIFGYITVYNCGYCQKTLTEQEYELLTPDLE